MTDTKKDAALIKAIRYALEETEDYLVMTLGVMHWNFVQFFYREIKRHKATRLGRDLPEGSDQ